MKRLCLPAMISLCALPLGLCLRFIDFPSFHAYGHQEFVGSWLLQEQSLERSRGTGPTFLDDRIAEGSDVIKIIYEDFGGRMPRLPKESMKAAIDAAHARGKLAMVHAGQRVEHVRDAIEAGADGVVHSFFDSVADGEFGKMFVSHGAFLMPTFPVQVSICTLPDNAALSRDPYISPWLTAEQAKQLNDAYGKPERHADCTGSFASIPILRDAGATILAGSDAGNSGTAQGASIHEEIEMLGALRPLPRAGP